jgi:transposase
MIDMALLSVIRRWYFREELSIREITRRTGLSRNTVKKYLASEETNPQYQRKKTPSKLDDYKQVLNGWLHRESSVPVSSEKPQNRYIVLSSSSVIQGLMIA